VDVTVWSVTLNSADAVANFLDQLEAADAMQMHGEVVGEVLGNWTSGEIFKNARAYRVPVLNHRGEPSFLVVDKETYDAMKKVAENSQASYAELARKDNRYAVSDQAKRHKAFRPQLKEHRATPEAWVDQERDFILAEELSLQRINTLDATGNEVDGYNADQLRPALENYRRQLNDFQMNFCRESRYRELAVGRLATRGVAGNAPDFSRLLVQEMNAVAWEYANRWNAFKSVTTRLLELQSIRNGTSDAQLDDRNIRIAEHDLLNFLANLDYELEIQTRATSTNIGEDAIRQVIPRRVLRSAREVTTIAPEPVALPDVLGRLVEVEGEIEGILGRPFTPPEVAARVTILAPEATPPEGATVENIVENAIFAAAENHDDDGYSWNERIRAGGYEAQRLRETVDRTTNWGSIMNSDTNTSRTAFIEGREAGLPDGSTLIGFQVKGEHVDSSDRTGVMSGVAILTDSEAVKLRGLLTARPEEFFDFVTRVNGEPLYSNDRKPIGIVRGNGLSIYSMDTPSVDNPVSVENLVFS